MKKIGWLSPCEIQLRPNTLYPVPQMIGDAYFPSWWKVFQQFLRSLIEPFLVFLLFFAGLKGMLGGTYPNELLENLIRLPTHAGYALYLVDPCVPVVLRKVSSRH